MAPCVVRKGSLGKTQLNLKVDPNHRLETQARQGLNENKLDLKTELLRLMQAEDTCLVFIYSKKEFSCVIDG